MDFVFTTAPRRVAASMCNPFAWEALRLGHRASPVAVRRGPAGLEAMMETPGEEPPADPFVYGHTGLVEAVLQGGSPGWRVDWRPEHYDRELWIERKGELMWNPKARILTLSEAQEQWRSGSMHLCPSGADSGPKAFKGFFCDRSDLAFELGRAARGNRLDPNMRVALSSLNLPEREYRCALIHGEIIAAGQYLREGALEETDSMPEEALAFAREAARGWLPGDFCVMDVAVKGPRMGVLEFNGLHASGLYSLRRELIIEAIAHAWPPHPRPKAAP